MKPRLRFGSSAPCQGLLVLGLLSVPLSAIAAPVVWSVNGHTYEAVLAPGISWAAAQSACKARGGYLATLTSAQEDAFVRSLIEGNSAFWAQDPWNDLGPWFGGSQAGGSSEPSGGWSWVTSEPWSYTNWGPGQPDNCCGGQEKHRFIRARGTTTAGWDDCETNNPTSHRTGYIFEGCTSTTDTDGDGLHDCWEEPTSAIPTLNGVFVGTTTGVPTGGSTDNVANRYPLTGSNPRHKDLFVEVDALVGRSPTPGALGAVVSAFANAPVANPDGNNGITLHIPGSGGDPSVDETTGNTPASWSFGDLLTYRAAHFGKLSEQGNAQLLTARAKAYRYGVFADLHSDGWTGEGEIWGSNFLVTLGSLYGSPGGDPTIEETAGTFMHELGHTLGLDHAGSAEFPNYKPNYFSVMNHLWQMPVRISDSCPNASLEQLLCYQTSWDLRFSSGLLPPLLESGLSEPAGIGGDAGRCVPIGPPPGVTALPMIVPMSGPVNWDRIGQADNSSAQADANYVSRDCAGIFESPSPGEALADHNDWAALAYAIPAAPGRLSTETHWTAGGSGELSVSAFLSLGSLQLDCNRNGLADAEDIAAGRSADTNGNGVPDECDAMVVGVPDGPHATPLYMRVRQNPVLAGATTQVELGIPVDGTYSLRVYNVAGVLVKTLLDTKLPGGTHIVGWDGRSEAGKRVSSGVYFAVLAGAAGRITNKLIVVK